MKNFKEIYDELDWEIYAELSQQIVNINDVQSELLNQSGRYAYYAGLSAYAQKKYDEITSKFDRYIAMVRKQQHELLSKAGVKITDKTIDAYVTSLPEYEEYDNLKTEAFYKLNLTKNLVNALGQRKDMLIQLSANNRTETKLFN